MKRIFTAVFLAIGTIAGIAPAYALTHYLTAQWFEGGSQFCRYDNGTVLNVGARTCPLSIKD